MRQNFYALYGQQISSRVGKYFRLKRCKRIGLSPKQQTHPPTARDLGLTGKINCFVNPKLQLKFRTLDPHPPTVQEKVLKKFTPSPRRVMTAIYGCSGQQPLLIFPYPFSLSCELSHAQRVFHQSKIVYNYTLIKLN